MTSVDELFRAKPSASSASNKRKFPATPSHDPSEFYKSAKTTTNGTPRSATVEDEAPENDDEVEAGPALPPSDDDSAAEDEDEEGRFFGSGVSADTRKALDYVDDAEDPEGGGEEAIDATWLRKTAITFEKKINKNAELRARHEAEPEKFVASEADLDADIKALSILAEHTDLYPEFVKLGSVGSLVTLLAHENTDIAIDAIQVLGELTDDDITVDEKVFRSLVDEMLKAGLAELLGQNLERLDEQDPSDRAGVYHVLSLIENLCNAYTGNKLGTDVTTGWLLERISRKGERVGQNMQYAAEILAILMQAGPLVKHKVADAPTNADTFLQLLSAYRKKDPEKGSDEAEYVENLFDCLVCIVDTEEGKKHFVEAEGVELCLIMLREGSMSKIRALRVLDHATSAIGGTPVCVCVVEAAGLGIIFAMFMKQQYKEVIEHLIGIFHNLLTKLESDTAAGIRTLAKFVEKDYAKITRIVEIRREYVARVKPVEAECEAEAKDLTEDEIDDMEGEWFDRKLAAGIYILRIVDVILACLVVTDEGAREKVKELLAVSNEDLEDLRRNVKGQYEELEQGYVHDETLEHRALMEYLIDCI